MVLSTSQKYGVNLLISTVIFLNKLLEKVNILQEKPLILQNGMLKNLKIINKW